MHRAVGCLTGFTDGNLVPIKVGDHILAPRHLDSSCCEHKTRCEVKWNDQWNAYGLQTEDGEWISGMGIVSGLFVERV